MEKISKTIYFQTHCHGRRDLPLDQVSQSHIPLVNSDKTKGHRIKLCQRMHKLDSLKVSSPKGGWVLEQALQKRGESSRSVLRYMVRILGLSCAGSGVGFSDACGSLSTQDTP